MVVMRQQPHYNHTAAQGLISDHHSLDVRILSGKSVYVR